MSDFPESDDLNALINSPTTAPADRRNTAPASYRPLAYSEGCPKCRGTGRFTSWGGRVLGECFACKGAGSKTFATSPQARAKAKERALVKRVEKANEIVESKNGFYASHPNEIAWLQQAAKRNSARAGSFTFPADLLDKLNQYGSLTDAQLGAVHKLMLRDTVHAAEHAAAAPIVEAAGIDRLKAAFDHAAAYTAAKARGLKVRSPAITLGDVTIKPAKATSANPGALYAYGADDEYLGKIKDGRFIAVYSCTDKQKADVVAFVSNPDPAQAAKVYGQETGVCCICNATLRSEWRLRGIGPICAEKFGW